MCCDMHFIYYMSKLIATNVHSTNLFGLLINRVLCLFVTGGCEPVTSKSLVRHLADCPTQVDMSSNLITWFIHNFIDVLACLV